MEFSFQSLLGIFVNLKQLNTSSKIISLLFDPFYCAIDIYNPIGSPTILLHACRS